MFDEKYSGRDIKRVNAANVETPDECKWLMRQLDLTIAEMDRQIGEAKADAATNGKYSDPKWFHSANHARRMAKCTRQAVQDRLGVLSREEKRKSQTRIERAFMDATLSLFLPEDIQEIWDEVYAKHPELRR